MVPIVDLCNHAFPESTVLPRTPPSSLQKQQQQQQQGQREPSLEISLSSGHSLPPPLLSNSSGESSGGFSNCEVFPFQDDSEIKNLSGSSSGSPSEYRLGCLLAAGERGVKKGEPLLVSYGDLGNDELLLDYGFYGGDCNPFDAAELTVSASFLDAAGAAAGVDLVLPSSLSEVGINVGGSAAGDGIALAPFQRVALELLGFGSDGNGTVSIALGRDRAYTHPHHLGGGESSLSRCAMDPVLLAAARVLASQTEEDLPESARAVLHVASQTPAETPPTSSSSPSTCSSSSSLVFLLGSLSATSFYAAAPAGGKEEKNDGIVTGRLVRKEREVAALASCLALIQRALTIFPTTFEYDQELLNNANSNVGLTSALTSNTETAIRLRVNKKKSSMLPQMRFSRRYGQSLERIASRENQIY